MRSRIALALAVMGTICGLFPQAAAADGQPAGFNAGASGISAPHGGSRYFTILHRHGTTVLRTADHGQKIVATRDLKSHVALPAVAFDGTPTGLSADGATLVLANATAGPFVKTSRFWVFSAEGLRLRKVVELKGSFTLDAVSPDGKTLYLIQYKPAGRRAYDPRDYLVRSYDLGLDRLDPQPIVDPREPDEKMQGLPMIREMSPNGVWAYTLYDGSDHGPFIHALDTRAGKAYCVELGGLVNRRTLYADRMTVAADGRSITVTGENGALALVDTRTFEVKAPTPDGSSEGPPWVLLLAAGAIGLAAALVLLAAPKRRRRPATT